MFMEFSDRQKTDTGIKYSDFSLKLSCRSIKIAVEALIEEIKPVLAEK